MWLGRSAGLGALDTASLQGLVLIALALSALGFASTIFLALRQRRLLRRYRALLTAESKGDVEGLLLQQLQELSQQKQSLSELAEQLNQLRTESHHFLQRAGIVRFNAFPDTGSDLSFAIAVLDRNRDGFVISSLYGRAESRVYAKPIKNGASTYALSAEEQSAIQQAMLKP